MEPAAKQKNEWWEWSKALLIAFGLAAIIRFFFFAPIVVDGESMMPTLENGDRMIVNKIEYNIGEPDRFDIVVFHYNEEKDFIKRIIGIPGDHVAYEDDQLYINGEPVEEPYLEEELAATDGLLTENFTLEEVTDGQSVIPEGYVFVLGDNRRASRDSRYIGLVPMEEVVGSTEFVFWPLPEAGFVQ